VKDPVFKLAKRAVKSSILVFEVDWGRGSGCSASGSKVRIDEGFNAFRRAKRDIVFGSGGMVYGIVMNVLQSSDGSYDVI